MYVLTHREIAMYVVYVPQEIYYLQEVGKLGDETKERRK